MSERASRPDVNACSRLPFAHHALSFAAAHIGTDKGADDVVLAADADRPSDTAQHTIDFLKIPVAIEIKHGQSRRLLAQFLVGHVVFPWQWAREHYDRLVSSMRHKTWEQVAKSFVASRGINFGVANFAHQTAAVLP